jgi:glycine dehydrogenase subunit 1
VKYTPNPPWVAQDMLNSMGLNSLDDLFDDIKDDLKLKKGLNLPPAMGEMELRRYMKDLAARNISTEEYPCFLGAGAYDLLPSRSVVSPTMRPGSLRISSRRAAKNPK